MKTKLIYLSHRVRQSMMLNLLVATGLSAVAFGSAAQMIPIMLDDMMIMIPNPEVRPVAKRLMGQGSLLGDSIASDFTTGVAMQAPAFRGLEPALGVSYASSNSNGFAGVGWTLTGLSQITRAGSDRGAPRYDGSDVWMLDGMELVPCAGGSVSPSCTTGGTHSTKLENYQRIKRVATNSWEITAKNGTKSNYTTAFNPAGPEYKTLLTSLVDTHNNTVTYSYVADGSNWMYPNQITYGGMSVTFYREARPDVVSLDAGGGKTLQMTQRLKLVDMKVGASRARAYRVSYSTGSNGNSQVSSVQMYGTTSTVDAAGNVSGTYLPPTSFTYTNGSEANTKAELIKEVNNGYGGSTKVVYNLATSFTNTSLPVQLYVMQTVSINDGRTGDSTTSFGYSDGKWDDVDQKFLGYLYTKSTAPCITDESACPYTETWMKQDFASAGKPERVEYRDGLGRIYNASQYVYTATSVAPFSSLLSEVYTEFHAGSSSSAVCPSATCKRNYMTQSYDGFGNPLLQTLRYDYGATNSKIKYTERSYIANNSAYIVDAVVRHRVYVQDRRNIAAQAKAVSVIGAKGARLYQNQAKGMATIMPIPLYTMRLLEEQYAYDQPLSSAGDVAILPTKGDRTHVYTYSDTNAYIASHKFEYDGFGNVVKTTDADGNTTSSIAYDTSYGLFPVTQTNHSNATTSLVTTRTWDFACQSLKSEIDPNLVTTKTMVVDDFCRTTRMDQPLGGFVSMEFCNTVSSTNQCGTLSGSNAQFNGAKAPSADGNGDQWAKSFVDGFLRTYQSMVKGPASDKPIQTWTDFDLRGNLSRTSEPVYAGAPKYVGFTYDAMNRAITSTNSDGTIIRTSYGLLSMLNTDAVGQTTSTILDTAGNITEETFKVAGTVYSNRYTYDEFSRRKSMTDAEGNVWRWNFDTAGPRVSVSDPDRGYWQFKFTGDEEPLMVIDAKANEVTLNHDFLSRKTGRTIKVPGTTIQVSEATWTYDQVRAGFYNKGQLTSMTDRSGSTTFDYDQAGRLVKAVKTIEGVAFAFEFGYDAAGRLKWKKMPNGLNVGTATAPLTYDGAGRPYAIPGIISSATYLADDKLDVVSFANGVITDYGYDTNHRLNRILTSKTGVTLQDYVYGRDAEGKIKTISSPFAGEGWAYTYDEGVKRLTAAVNASNAADNQSFGFSPSGNMSYNSRIGSYSYPAAGATAIRPHAVTQAGATAYSYDQNGNVFRKGSSAEYTWNELNQLTGIGAVASTPSSTYLYDGGGSRVRKTTGGVKTYYPSPEFSYSGTTARASISFAGTTVATISNVSGTNWTHTDHLGSINVVTNSSGVEVQRQRHRPFGERFNASNTNFEKEFDFLGERLDAESGLVYQRARFFDPALARYIAPDTMNPSIYEVGSSRYGYALSDPVNRMDNGNIAPLIYGGFMAFNYARTAYAVYQMGAVSGAALAQSGAVLALYRFKQPVTQLVQNGFNYVNPNWSLAHNLGFVRGFAKAGGNVVRSTPRGPNYLGSVLAKEEAVIWATRNQGWASAGSAAALLPGDDSRRDSDDSAGCNGRSNCVEIIGKKMTWFEKLLYDIEKALFPDPPDPDDLDSTPTEENNQEPSEPNPEVDSGDNGGFYDDGGTGDSGGGSGSSEDSDDDSDYDSDSDDSDGGDGGD